MGGGITYKRWASLTQKPTSDDADLSDARLRNVFAPVKCPILVTISGTDSSYPPNVKANLPALLDRFRQAAPTLSPLSTIIDGAPHTLDDGEHADEFVKR